MDVTHNPGSQDMVNREFLACRSLSRVHVLRRNLTLAQISKSPKNREVPVTSYLYLLLVSTHLLGNLQLRETTEHHTISPG